MMIRGCAVDSGTLTTDTEIIRMSHCGAFYFNERSETIKQDLDYSDWLARYVRGCVQSCSDVDGCNAGDVSSLSLLLAGLTIFVVLQ